MINERSSAQANTPTSANMQYGYPTNHYDLMSIPPMQNPNDLYSYYPPSLYQPFGTFEDHSQWGTADTSGNVPPPPPGPMQFHPQMYTPSPLDIPRSPFDYPAPHHAYPHYHPGFTPSTFPGPPSTGTSAFDMSWNPHNLSMQQMQVAAQQQMTPIGGGPTSIKKASAYDEYPVSDMLAQHMNAVDLGSSTTNDDTNNYDNGTNDSTQNVNVLSSKEQQQHYQTNSSNLSLSSRPSQIPSSSTSSGPKSYASVVSSDTINTNNNKSTSSVPNMPIRSTVQSSTNEHINATSNFSNDSTNSRSNTNMRGNNNNTTNNYSQQTRNGTGGYNSRNQQQQQQQQQSSTSGGFNWTNSSLSSNSRGNNTNNNTSSNYYNSGSSNYYDRPSYSQQQQQQTSSNNNKRPNLNYQQNYSSSRTANNMSNGSGATSAIGQQPISAANQETLDSLKRNHQYNPKDFNLNPKGARFFVIKSYSEDDVHRSIKYNIWCSTEHGNKRLDAAFREREGKGPIYLFFSVNASGHFCGMAEMMSPIDYEHKTDVWQMSNKWQGKFEVKWIYVKDVPNQQFRNIRLENNDNKPVTNSRDTQEIPYEKGKLMLKTMHMYRDKTSIFDDFQYYESKQAEETTKKPSNNDFMNTNTRGNNNKRQYSSNKASTISSDQQQQQQQQHQNENINNEDNK
ncbi:unnamed protein product [Rotaria sp. Silwood2]|nr:unnamed protein product [Rotaria sp. Silwood2]CAF2740372.1 unnamed protein product [Rotaria sp. Silwood2]CAF3157705.1 unnamed protein product [Rotaria sp. Silwood2]CAF4032704.1 unnamed protein product [Rotaria sp. Silwood2]CAF4098436.1 unnamed protein product [Rotaria sp. Silwood2]